MASSLLPISLSAMGSIFPLWQAVALSAIVVSVIASSLLGLTRRIRSVTQPWVTRRVAADVPHIIRLQRIQCRFLDSFFSVLSCTVSIQFYTAFIPFLIWGGHSKLGRQVCLLIFFADYFGDALKDLVSAPRPSCPPVRRVTATSSEKEHAMEYGLPSSHCLNTICLFGYLLHYVVTNGMLKDGTAVFIGFSLFFLLVVLIAIARLYLGMHSIIDIIAGSIIGLVILAFWLSVHEYVDEFIVSGQNVTFFWACISFLSCFAYPTPEFPTPSFDYHTACNGVVFGVVIGIQQTYMQFHHADVSRVFSSELPLLSLLGRVLVGIPMIVVAKSCSKELAKWLLPVICNTLGIRIRSSCYVPSLKESDTSKIQPDNKQSSYFQRVVSLIPHQTFDVDTGIRFLQYTGLGWSATELAPYLFSYLKM